VCKAKSQPGAPVVNAFFLNPTFWCQKHHFKPNKWGYFWSLSLIVGHSAWSDPNLHRAWDTLEVGGVVIGDVPSWRVDHMPYGGVKDSGLGREGVRFAIEDMTEIRLMVIRTP
jgi:hypothetical protein